MLSKTVITKFYNRHYLPYIIATSLGLLIGYSVILAGDFSAVLILMPLFLILMIFVFAKPKVLFLCLIFCLPLTGFGIFEIGAKVTLSKIFAVIICLLLITRGMFGKHVSFVRTPFDGFLVAFFILVIFVDCLRIPSIPLDVITASDVGTLRSPGFRSLIQILNLLIMISVYFSTLIIVKDKKMVTQSINTLFLSTFLVGIYGLYQFIGKLFSWPFIYLTQIHPGMPMPGIQGFPGESISRINSFLEEPKHLAFFLIPIISLILYLLVKKQIKRAMFYPFLFMLLFIFLMSFSRSGLVILGISFVILILISLGKKRLLSSLKITCLIVILLITSFSIFYCFTGSQGTSALKHVWGSISYATFKETIDYPKIRATLETFAEHPIFGVGFGNIPFFISRSEWASWFASDQINISPNQFLMILAENGIIGFSLFACFIFGSLISSFQKIKKIQVPFWKNVSTAFFLAVAGILIVFQYESQLNYPFLWFYLGMLKAVVNTGLEEERRLQHFS